MGAAAEQPVCHCRGGMSTREPDGRSARTGRFRERVFGVGRLLGAVFYHQRPPARADGG
jgi:hypothetical protein